VAKKTAANTNEFLAPQIAKKALTALGGLLIFVGKPLFKLLSLLFVVAVALAYYTGAATQLLFRKILLAAALGLKKAGRVKKPKKPKIDWARFKFLAKLVGLRIKLQVAKAYAIKIRRPKLRLRLPVFILAVIGVPLLLIFAFWLAFIRGLPHPRELTTRKVEVSTKIYDREGVLLYKIFKDQNRTPVPLEEIPLHVRLATLAIEDAEFYQHPGFSLRGIFRAIVRNVTKGELSGGSTITQQLVKNALLTPEKTFSRKVREMILSIEVEATYSKDDILEMYLNEVSYGGTAYGIQEAASVYFGKDVSSLTLAEAALLAGLPKSPTKFSPFGPNPQTAFERQKEVLRLMAINKFITHDEARRAMEQKISFAPNRTDIKAPHFVMYVRDQLVERYGEEVVETGGLEVITTLDYEIQKLAEGVVKEEVDKLARLNVSNGAVVVLNPQTGEILAMVGSKDYFDTEHDGNVNVTTSLRQPGSSIKIVNYAQALANGYTAASILSDTPVTFSVPGQPPYSPKNYDGAFRGNLSLRSALAESRNVPAVKVLASYGVAKMLETGTKMGITTWTDPSRYGLSLTLGGGEIKLIDLARAYATIASMGKRPVLTSIQKITNYKGKVLDHYSCSAGAAVVEIEAAETRPSCFEQVIDSRVAFILVDILRDNHARAPAFGSFSQLVIPGRNDIAVKTGTSNDLKDNLTLGFNQKFLVAVWVGNNDATPMARIASGVTGAAPIWNRIMGALVAQSPEEPWTPPAGLEQVAICSLTGTLACEGCPTKVEWFLSENKPTKACVPRAEEQKPEGSILEPAASIEATPTPRRLRPPRFLR
jgi:1A family penicillin-binding protein